MKKLIKISTIILSMTIASCASKRTLTREEWLKIGQKTYEKIDKEKIIKSAEKVLVLIDGDDVEFSHTQKGFIASRHWMVYAVVATSIGTDYWTFETEEKDGKIITNLYISSTAGSIASHTSNSNASTITSPTVGSPVQGKAIYDLFYGRLDYILGLTDQWISCDFEEKKIEKKETWGRIDPACDSVTVKNDYPNNLSMPEINRLFPGENDHYEKMKYLKKNNPIEYEKLWRSTPPSEPF